MTPGSRQKRLRAMLTGLSLCVVALLIAMAFMLNRQQRHAVRDWNPASPDTVNALHIDRPGHARISLLRDGALWILTAPWALAANAQRVEALLDLSDSLSTGYLAEDVDLEAAGLAPPQATLSFDALRMDLGLTDLGGQRRYARIDERVYFVPDWSLSLINGGVSALVDRTLFTAPLKTLEWTDHGIELPPEQPLPSELDTNHAQLSLWQSLSAEQIVDWPREDAPPLQRAGTLKIEFADGSGRSYTLEWRDNWVAFIPVAARGYAWILDPEKLPLR